MKTKKNIFLTILFFICTISINAQNLLKYENKLISIRQHTTYSDAFIGLDVNIGTLSIEKNILTYNLNNGPKNYLSRNELFNNYKITVDTVIQTIILKMNESGYSLKSSNKIIINDLSQGQEALSNIDLIFEKTTSYREEELYKLLGELNTKIDTTSKGYIEKAKNEININVLNYLKNIPNDVLGKAYKEELQSYINTAINKKLSDLKEQIVSELNKKP